MRSCSKFGYTVRSGRRSNRWYMHTVSRILKPNKRILLFPSPKYCKSHARVWFWFYIMPREVKSCLWGQEKFNLFHIPYCTKICRTKFFVWQNFVTMSKFRQFFRIFLSDEFLFKTSVRRISFFAVFWAKANKYLTETFLKMLLLIYQRDNSGQDLTAI